jgi:hypothetical protein
VLDSLYKTLEKMGINPIGSDTVDSSAWVEERILDPLADEVEEEIEPAVVA